MWLVGYFIIQSDCQMYSNKLQLRPCGETFCKVTRREKKRGLSSKIASLFKTRVAKTPFPLYDSLLRCLGAVRIKFTLFCICHLVVN